MFSGVARYAVMFAIATGLRRSEVLALRWEHLDAARRVIRLKPPPRAAGYVRGPRRKARRVGLETKTRERDVPLTPLALKLLASYGMRTNGLIFPMAASSLTQAWRRGADRIGLVDARLDGCRREAVSRLVDEY